MTANIPNELLKKYSGYGFYGYENSSFKEKTIPIPEYSIPIEEMKQEYIVTINDTIDFGLGSKEGEFEKYLILIYELLKKYENNYHQVANFLLQNNLAELLNIEEDNRNEEQIKIDTQKLVNKFISKSYLLNREKDDEIETFSRK